MAKSIGPTFGGELQVAGLGGLSFSWGEDGSFYYGPTVTQTQKNQIAAVYAAHDPVKSYLLDYSENSRYNLMTGGITINGIFISTDLQSQQMLQQSQSYCITNSGAVIQWKLPDFTFHSYSAAEVISLFNTVMIFVENCFNKENTINSAIKAGSITTNAQIDSQYATVPTSY